MQSPGQDGDGPMVTAHAPATDADVVRSRSRSFCFLERDGLRWTAFLITYQRTDEVWRGYFKFRTVAEGTDELTEVRTADLFVEWTEEEVDAHARGLGRPLMMALLESAIETHERRRGFSADAQSWFRDMLRRHAAERTRSLVVPLNPHMKGVPPTLTELRSLYESYRLDQVSHLIALLDAAHFRELVEVRLEGRRIDFHSRDRLQLAMSVVQDLERWLPLPPFELWVEDYLAHVDEYRRYTRELHGGGDLD